MIPTSLSRKQYAEEHAEMNEKEIEIVIAPPFNIARLLRITRYLETQNLKIRQTSGNWRDGVVLNVQSDKPVHFNEILKDAPNVRRVTMTRNQSKLPANSRAGQLSTSIHKQNSRGQILIALG